MWIPLRGHEQPGWGKMHARFNPTCTVTMRFDYEIRINSAAMELISSDDKVRGGPTVLRSFLTRDFFFPT